uniref:Uncharacterized protein n=1 Tax=Aegilops tauschii TaxID=37682 RepID=R7VZQ8_AEGTA
MLQEAHMHSILVSRFSKPMFLNEINAPFVTALSRDEHIGHTSLKTWRSAVAVAVTSLEMDQFEGESWRPENREGSIFFPTESWRRGEPELRPEVGRYVLRRMAGMYRLEEKLCSRVLVGTVEGNRPPVSPAQVGAALEAQCGVCRDDVMVEVCSPPADFLVRFRSGEDCTRVLIYHSRKLTVGGETIQFSRWHHGKCGDESSMKFLTRLSFDGLPQEAWEVEFVTNLVSSLDSDLVKTLKPTDRCFVVVEAWMKNPNK